MENKNQEKTELSLDQMEMVSGGAEDSPCNCPYCKAFCKDRKDLFLHLQVKHNKKG